MKRYSPIWGRLACLAGLAALPLLAVVVRADDVDAGGSEPTEAASVVRLSDLGPPPGVQVHQVQQVDHAGQPVTEYAPRGTPIPGMTGPQGVGPGCYGQSCVGPQCAGPVCSGPMGAGPHCAGGLACSGPAWSQSTNDMVNGSPCYRGGRARLSRVGLGCRLVTWSARCDASMQAGYCRLRHGLCYKLHHVAGHLNKCHVSAHPGAGMYDQRDSVAYSAEGWGTPVSVPLAPTVKYVYNYSWGIPSSRLTPVGATFQNYYPDRWASVSGPSPGAGMNHPPVVQRPTDTMQTGFYHVHVPSWQPMMHRPH